MPPARLAGLAAALLVALQASTQTFAWLYRYHATLGPALRLDETGVYWPWMILVWRQRFGTAEADAFALPLSVFMLVMAAGAGGLLLFDGGDVKRTRGWGGLAEARRAGLRHDAGCVLGRLQGRLLATTDLRPTLVTGGTRSGKGRGHVIPTLLSWTDSVLVHDPKGELWRVTAGWRAQHSHALYFNPRDPASARFNPLAEIRPGPQELAQVQRLVAILSDPGGARDDEAIWDKAASEILEAVILHVLYTAPDADKTLLAVRTILADLDAAADVMVRTLHRLGPEGVPEVHPFISTAVKGYAAMHDRFRTSVQGTARSYLKWLAGDDLVRAMSASDFAIGDPVPISPGRVAWRERDIARWNASRGAAPEPAPAAPPILPTPPRPRKDGVLAAPTAKPNRSMCPAATKPKPRPRRRAAPVIADGQLGFDF